MTEVKKEAATTKKVTDRHQKLSLEDQLLLSFSDWREYQTQFHIAATYGIHESSANRSMESAENLAVLASVKIL